MGKLRDVLSEINQVMHASDILNPRIFLQILFDKKKTLVIIEPKQMTFESLS